MRKWHGLIRSNNMAEDALTSKPQINSLNPAAAQHQEKMA
jgi:hypothetical protein